MSKANEAGEVFPQCQCLSYEQINLLMQLSVDQVQLWVCTSISLRQFTHFPRSQSTWRTRNNIINRLSYLHPRLLTSFNKHSLKQIQTKVCGHRTSEHLSLYSTWSVPKRLLQKPHWTPSGWIGTLTKPQTTSLKISARPRGWTSTNPNSCAPKCSGNPSQIVWWLL